MRIVINVSKEELTSPYYKMALLKHIVRDQSVLNTGFKYWLRPKHFEDPQVPAFYQVVAAVMLPERRATWPYKTPEDLLKAVEPAVDDTERDSLLSFVDWAYSTALSPMYYRKTMVEFLKLYDKEHKVVVTLWKPHRKRLLSEQQIATYVETRIQEVLAHACIIPPEEQDVVVNITPEECQDVVTPSQKTT
jgi:hypothetical protein